MCLKTTFWFRNLVAIFYLVKKIQSKKKEEALNIIFDTFHLIMPLRVDDTRNI